MALVPHLSSTEMHHSHSCSVADWEDIVQLFYVYKIPFILSCGTWHQLITKMCGWMDVFEPLPRLLAITITFSSKYNFVEFYLILNASVKHMEENKGKRLKKESEGANIKHLLNPWF